MFGEKKKNEKETKLFYSLLTMILNKLYIVCFGLQCVSLCFICIYFHKRMEQEDNALSMLRSMFRNV